jgi:hypothetical protein
MTRMDAFSLTTVAVEQYANGKKLGSATAFVWLFNSKYYLVTNWHVVTGRNAQTKELELPCRPENLRAYFSVDPQKFWKQPVDLPLYDDALNPIWLKHPDHNRRNIDLAALPVDHIAEKAGMSIHPINTLRSDVDLEVSIGMDVFILGYPFGFSLPGFPIWKRGSIASEPDLVHQTDGYLHVDTASRPGMSGAPVIRRSWGTHSLASGGTSSHSVPQSKFIGVYSGRRHTTDPSDAQIGMVWMKRDVEELIAVAMLDV